MMTYTKLTRSKFYTLDGQIHKQNQVLLHTDSFLSLPDESQGLGAS